MPRAARAAAAIKQELGIESTLIEGSGGIFVIEVDGATVARKTRERGFPTEQEIVQAVRTAQ